MCHLYLLIRPEPLAAWVAQSQSQNVINSKILARQLSDARGGGLGTGPFRIYLASKQSHKM